MHAMTRKLSEAEILELAYGDANLVSLTWRGECQEPTFVVTLARERPIVLAFTWPEVDVALNSKHGFVPLSFEGGDTPSCQRLGDGRWRVILDFGHQGTVFITCNDVYREEA
jgi:hypothetical protein